METYARFLSMTDTEINETLSLPVQPDTPLLGPRRVRKVSALSDFAPVNLKVRRYVVCSDPKAWVNRWLLFQGGGAESEAMGGTRSYCISLFDGRCWCVVPTPWNVHKLTLIAPAST